MSIQVLPDDCIKKIFSYCDENTIKNCSRVNYRFLRLIFDEIYAYAIDSNKYFKNQETQTRFFVRANLLSNNPIDTSLHPMITIGLLKYIKRSFSYLPEGEELFNSAKEDIELLDISRIGHVLGNRIVVSDSRFTKSQEILTKRLMSPPFKKLNEDAHDSILATRTGEIYERFASSSVINRNELIRSLSHFYSTHYSNRRNGVSIGDFSKLNLLTLAPNIALLENLRELNLSNNKLVTVPEELTLLKYLENLDLSNNRLGKVPEAIGKITSLRCLSLHRTNLTGLNSELEPLHLKELDLSGNEFISFPSSICSMASLETLKLGFCNLSELVPECKNMSSLKDIDLCHNNFDAFPLELIEIPSLCCIRMPDCKIKHIPFQIVEMPMFKLSRENDDVLYLDLCRNFLSPELNRNFLGVNQLAAFHIAVSLEHFKSRNNQ